MTLNGNCNTGATSIAQLCAWVAADGPSTDRLSDAEMVDLAYRLLLAAEFRLRGRIDTTPTVPEALRRQAEAKATLDAALAAQDALAIMRDHSRPDDALPTDEPSVRPLSQCRRRDALRGLEVG